MYLENLKTRDFYVMNDNEALAYMEHVSFTNSGKHLDDEFGDDKDGTIGYGVLLGELLPCNDDTFDYWHVIPYHENHAYSVDRIREGDLFIAESLVTPKEVFAEPWLKLHRYEFKYRLSE